MCWFRLTGDGQRFIGGTARHVPRDGGVARKHLDVGLSDYLVVAEGPVVKTQFGHHDWLTHADERKTRVGMTLSQFGFDRAAPSGAPANDVPPVEVSREVAGNEVPLAWIDPLDRMPCCRLEWLLCGGKPQCRPCSLRNRHGACRERRSLDEGQHRAPFVVLRQREHGNVGLSLCEAQTSELVAVEVASRDLARTNPCHHGQAGSFVG